MLEHFLVTQIFAWLLIFTRVGSGVMVMPGIGEAFVSPRFRLILALMLALVLTPVLQSYMPPVPDSPASLLALVLAEATIGIAIGTVARMIVAVMHIAGMIISANASLSLAMQFDITQASQGSLIGNFMSIAAMVLLFTLDLHYVMLRGFADSYTLFAPGLFPPMGDMASYFSHLMSDIFMMGVKIAAPSIVIALLIYLGAGILSRLMPNMQVFFIIQSPQIFLNLFLMLAIFSAVMLEFAGFFSDQFSSFLQNPE